MSREKQIVKSTDWLTKGYSEEELAKMKEKAIKEAEAELREKQIEEMARIFIDADDKRACWAATCPKCEFFEVNGEYCKACFGTKALYNAGYRKQSEWISVDERLPTSGELVLVNSMDKITKKHGWFYLASYDKERKWWNGASFGRVTHWMPLPEAPKGGAE